MAAAAPPIEFQKDTQFNFGVQKTNRAGKKQWRILQIDFHQQYVNIIDKGLLKNSYEFKKVVRGEANPNDLQSVSLFVRSVADFEGSEFPVVINAQTPQAARQILWYFNMIVGGHWKVFATDFLKEPVLHRGAVVKYGKLVQSNRMLLLHRWKLLVFKTDIAMYPMHAVALSPGCTSLSDTNNKEFIVSTSGDFHKFQFVCKDAEEALEWVEKITAASTVETVSYDANETREPEAQESIDILLRAAASSAEGWCPMVNEGDVFVSLKIAAGAHLYSIKAENIPIAVPPSMLCNAFINYDIRKQWDTTLRKMDVLESIDANTDVLHMVYNVQQLGITYDIVVFCWKYALAEDRFVVAFRSTVKEFKPAGNVVFRRKIKPVGFLIQPHPQNAEHSLLTFVEIADLDLSSKMYQGQLQCTALFLSCRTAAENLNRLQKM